MEAVSRLKSDDLAQTLAAFTNEELAPLFELLSGPISSLLAHQERVKAAHPNHVAYADLIAKELCLFGGNTIVNMGRGGGPSYREIVADVCASLKVKTTRAMSVTTMEQALLAKLFEALPTEDKDIILAEAAERFGYNADLGSNASVAAMIAAQAGGRAAGFLLYRTGLQVVNMASKVVIGRGLSFAGNAAFTRLLGVAIGPVGWIVSGLWALKDIASPAYRVTTPAVLIIAGTRQAKLWQSMPDLAA